MDGGSVDLKLSHDEALVEQTFTNFFESESQPSRVRAAEPLGFDESLWRQVVEMGAPLMGVPAAMGGSELSSIELVLVAQAAGRRLAPVPLVETMTAANLLARAGAHDLVRSIGAGSVATIVLNPPVDGRCRLVPAGAVADIVVALDGEHLVALRRIKAGGRPYIAPPPNFGASPIADIRLDDQSFERIVIASGADARSSHASAVSEWTLLMAAALDGLRDTALDIGVAYVKGRKAFGVIIGWFQAIQHRFANVSAEGDGGRILLYRAAWARKMGHATADNLALMAFLFISDVAFRTCRESLQFHGGYGYTLEYDIQLFLRRAKAWPLSLGDPAHGYSRLAERLYPVN